MRYPLTIADEYGNILTVVNDEEQLYDYLEVIDGGEIYEVPSLDDDSIIYVIEGMRAAFCYNPVGFAQYHSFVLLEWPELLCTCPKCDGQGFYGSDDKLVCEDCGERFDPINLDDLIKGKITRRR